MLFYSLRNVFIRDAHEEGLAAEHLAPAQDSIRAVHFCGRDIILADLLKQKLRNVKGAPGKKDIDRPLSHFLIVRLQDARYCFEDVLFQLLIGGIQAIGSYPHFFWNDRFHVDPDDRCSVN